VRQNTFIVVSQVNVVRDKVFRPSPSFFNILGRWLLSDFLHKCRGFVVKVRFPMDVTEILYCLRTGRDSANLEYVSNELGLAFNQTLLLLKSLLQLTHLVYCFL
jgi:hypothetical protein